MSVALSSVGNESVINRHLAALGRCRKGTKFVAENGVGEKP
jgi:hypothetical protein